jgi:hypothetical protein
VSFVSFKIAKNCTSFFKLAIFFTFAATSAFATTAQALEVDFTRRQVEFNKVDDSSRLPAAMTPDEQSKSIVEKVFDGKLFETVEPAQEIVIMNTDKGFVPETLNLKKGTNYKLHIVNINGKEKNVSFVMDAFSEHHNTFFGEHKTFNITPKVDGIFSFQCPETAMQGKLIIYSDSIGTVGPSVRKPASK